MNASYLHPLAAGILCGGQSSRMGRDKARLAFRDPQGFSGSLLQRACAHVRMHTQQVAVLGGPAPCAAAPCDAPVIADHPDVPGPAGGVAAALCWAPPGCDLLVTAVDMPDLDGAALGRFLAAARATGRPAWIHGPDGPYPLPLFVPGACRRNVLEAALQFGHSGLRVMLQLGGGCPVAPPFLSTFSAFQDLDTPEAWDGWLARTGAQEIP